MPRRPCLDCGAISDQSRCRTCRLARERQRNQRREGTKTWGRKRLRRAINKAGGAHCTDCGNWYPPHHIQVDHTQALADGGTDTPDNVQPRCLNCHNNKTTTEHRNRTTRT